MVNATMELSLAWHRAHCPKWTSCNKWIQMASASLNNGDYRVAEKTMGGKTNSVCEDPPIISIKRVQVGPTRVAIGRHQVMPVKIKKRKLPILNQKMLIQIFYSWKLPPLHPNMFVRRDAKWFFIYDLWYIWYSIFPEKLLIASILSSHVTVISRRMMGHFKAILIDAVSSSTSHFYVPRGEFNFAEKLLEN